MKKSPNATTKPLFVSFLLDETGSMQSIAEPTVSAYNNYLEGLKEADADVFFSLITFNSNDTRKHFVAHPVSDVPPMRQSDYRPGAMTPLIDAACKLIQATDEAVEAQDDEVDCIVVIQTDGQENCSAEFTSKDLAALVKKFTAKGWQFVFLGAGLDAFETARSIGMDIGQDRVLSFARNRSHSAYDVMKAKTARFAMSRQAAALDFSPKERDEAGDEFHERRKPQEPKKTRKSDGGGTVDDFSLLD